MVTLKNLLTGAATAAVGVLAMQKAAEARKPLSNTNASPLDGLDKAANYDYGDYYGDYGDYGSPSPAPAPYFGGSGDNSSVPCLDVELIAGLDLIIVDFDSANITNCTEANDLNSDIFTSLEGAFAPDVVTSNNFVQSVYATLDSKLQSIAGFTQSSGACDNTTAYSNRIGTAVDSLLDTLTLLDNVTTCEPYIN